MDEREDRAVARVGVDRSHRPEGHVYRLTVSNPARLNVLDPGTIGELTEALAEIARDEAVRAVSVHGAGDHAWIGGADIHELVRLDRDSAPAFIRALHELCAAVRELPVPVVAAIRGYCLGAGLELAASCDIRIAAENARFGMPEVLVGVPSVIEAALLPRLVGAGRARDLVLTGRMLDAEEALAWGLVETVADNDALEATLELRLGQILAAAPGAIRLQKALCRQWEEQPLSKAIEAGIEAFGQAYETDEPAAYQRRFLDRRSG